MTLLVHDLLFQFAFNSRYLMKEKRTGLEDSGNQLRIKSMITSSEGNFWLSLFDKKEKKRRNLDILGILFLCEGPESQRVTRRLKYLWAIFTNDRQRPTTSGIHPLRKEESQSKGRSREPRRPEGRSRFVELLHGRIRGISFTDEFSRKPVYREKREPSARPFEAPNRGLFYLFPASLRASGRRRTIAKRLFCYVKYRPGTLVSDMYRVSASIQPPFDTVNTLAAVFAGLLKATLIMRISKQRLFCDVKFTRLSTGEWRLKF